MKKNQIIILSSFLFVLLIAGAVYSYVFHGEHRNIASEDATVILSADELHAYFLNNESLATTNYLDKVLETTGSITAIENNSVVLNNRLQVSFNSEDMSKLISGSSLAIKGRCVGYDELLDMVKIDQAVIIHKEN